MDRAGQVPAQGVPLREPDHTVPWKITEGFLARHSNIAHGDDARWWRRSRATSSFTRGKKPPFYFNVRFRQPMKQDLAQSQNCILDMWFSAVDKEGANGIQGVGMILLNLFGRGEASRQTRFFQLFSSDVSMRWWKMTSSEGTKILEVSRTNLYYVCPLEVIFLTSYPPRSDISSGSVWRLLDYPASATQNINKAFLFCHYGLDSLHSPLRPVTATKMKMSSKEGWIDKPPTEIVIEVFKYLPRSSLISFRKTNRKALKILDANITFSLHYCYRSNKEINNLQQRICPQLISSVFHRGRKGKRRDDSFFPYFLCSLFKSYILYKNGDQTKHRHFDNLRILQIECFELSRFERALIQCEGGLANLRQLSLSVIADTEPDGSVNHFIQRQTQLEKLYFKSDQHEIHLADLTNRDQSHLKEVFVDLAQHTRLSCLQTLKHMHRNKLQILEIDGSRQNTQISGRCHGSRYLWEVKKLEECLRNGRPVSCQTFEGRQLPRGTSRSRSPVSCVNSARFTEHVKAYWSAALRFLIVGSHARRDPGCGLGQSRKIIIKILECQRVAHWLRSILQLGSDAGT